MLKVRTSSEKDNFAEKMSSCIYFLKSFNQNELTAQQPLNGAASSLKVGGTYYKYTHPYPHTLAHKST